MKRTSNQKDQLGLPKKGQVDEKKNPIVKMNTMQPEKKEVQKNARMSGDVFTQSNDEFMPTQAPIFGNKNKSGKIMFGSFEPGKRSSAIQQESIGSKSLQPTADQPNAWRNDQDPHKLYQIDKYLKMGNIIDCEVAELTRWRQADTKGNRKQQYLKTITKNNDQLMVPVKQSRLELLQSYEDGWPLLSQRKQIRRIAIYINMVATSIRTHKAFEATSIGIILLNCVQLAADNNTSGESSSFMETIDRLFLAAYTLEMIIKILSLGLVFNEGAYLRDAFNILDCTIVLSAYLQIIQEAAAAASEGPKQKGVSLNALRAFRVLRPLRSITAIKGLRILVQSLLAALPLLKDTIIVLVFFLLIFAIAGNQLISGNLKSRCINIYTGQMFIGEEQTVSDGGLLCGAHACPSKDHYCGKMNANPDNGVTNFDNIFWAFMNTFQNITLEGWSDTMKYYEMTSGIVIIVFFISSVFIGAFFLLNLTLAVINSSFSRMNEKYQKQAQEEKEKKRRLFISQVKKEDEDENDQPAAEEEQDRMMVGLGLNEYFVAKRAIKKMIDFFKKKKEERARIEDELALEAKLKEAQEQEELLRLNQKKNEPKQLAPIKKPTPQGNKVMDEPSPLLSPTAKKRLEEHKAKQDQLRAGSQSPKKEEFRLNPMQGTFAHRIVEEDSELSDNLDIKKEVEHFLKEIDSERHQSPSKFKQADHEVSASKIKDLIEMKAPAIARKKKHEAVPSMHSDSIAFLDEFAIDKIIAEEHLQPQNVQTTKKPSDENKNSGADISLQLSWDFPQYLSDNDIERKTKLILADDVESAISSDPSFTKEFMELGEKAKQAKQHTRNVAQDRAEFKEARKRYRRQKTLESRARRQHVEDQDKSTFYQEPSARHELVQNIAINASLAGHEKKAEPDVNLKPQKKDNRKTMAEHYKQIDDGFLGWTKPKDPYQYVDRKLKKIDINPGKKYISSSQEDVLEPRRQFKKIADKGKSMINKYLKPANFQDLYQDEYIEPLFDAYQLKTVYEVKQVEQVEFDSDDEDNLILAIQPYDTITSVGFAHQLQHLPTKFLTRRSDIIVSSTMSITLTPQDDEFQPKNTNIMNDEELKDWVDLRHEYRAMSISQAKLLVNDTQPHESKSVIVTNKLNNSSTISVTEVSAIEEEDEQPPIKKSETIGSNQSQSKVKMRKLPRGGLSKPLDPKEIMQLDDDQKIFYNKWKGKFDSSVRMLKKRKEDPEHANKQWTLAEARSMLEGTFHNEDEEDDKEEPAFAFLNRQNMKEDLDLGGFEQVVEQMIREEQLEKEQATDKNFLAKNKQDEVSDDIRAEFDLPENIMDNKVNFNEVRRSDVTKKRRSPVWSGQDVMCVSYNLDHAEYVTEMMSTVRVWPKGFAGVLKRARWLLRKFIMSSFMDNVMTLCVFVNTVIMALDRYGIKKDEEFIMDNINKFFTFTFIAEFGMKIVAIGPKKYIDNRMNLLDGGVVMLSLIELAMGSGGKGSLSAFRSVRVFRTFRVLRVARILRALKSMQNIIAVIARSASSFAYISMLLMIFLFIFSLLGMQIFGGNFNFPDGKPRGNYDSFNIAFLTAFQTLTMENWNSLFYDAIRSSTLKLISALYYITWIFVGNFILLNLFLAILLDSFLEEDDEDQSSEEAQAAQKLAEELQKKKLKQEKERRLKKLGTSLQLMQSQLTKKPKKTNPGLVRATKDRVPADQIIDDIDDLDEKQLIDHLVDLKFYKLESHEIAEETFEDAEIECNRSLYLFSQENWFRNIMFKFMKTKFFDNFVMVLIVLSSIKLAADSYIVEQIKAEEGIAYMISSYSDLFFTVAFTIEMTTKIISMGLIMDSGSYLRESWNQLDFFIVMTSLLDLMMTGTSIGFIKVIRILRILRPLRFISHNKSMKMIVAALLDSGGSMLNVMIVIMIVWLMFAILAINLFSGKFFYCDQEMYLLHSKADCLKAGYNWKRFDTNFDNAAEAMKSLFIIATFEGWPDIMYQAVDATGVDQGPKFESQIIYGYFFVAFILIGSFFFVNFLIGVLFLKYSQAQKEEIKNFTTEQLNWIDIQKLIEKSEVDHAFRYQPRDSYYRLKLWKLVNAEWFGLVVMAAILLNMVQMACSYDGMPEYWQQTLKISNYIFSSIFLVECILKLIVYRKTYFYTTWNKFDFFVVSASILDVVMDMIGGAQLKALSVAPQLARVLRVLRVSRVLRLAGKNEGLQALLMTIQMSVQSLLNVTALLMLIFFMFAVLGVSLFQGVTQSDEIYTLQLLDPEYKNFSNFHLGFILIFVIATGESWPLAMYDVGNVPPFCGETTCGSSFSFVYFIMFVMVVQKIMLNLFILVIIQQFETYYVSDDSPIQKFKSNLVLFEKVWIEFTAKHDHVKIKEKHLNKFFRKLPPPIGIPDDVSENELKRQMLKMGIRVEEGFIYFNELLYRSMRRVYGKFKLNRQMTVFEISTQFRLLKIREQMQKDENMQIVTDQKLMVKKLSKGQFAFNPFMLHLFHRITFNKWLNMARVELAKKENDERMKRARREAEEFGLDFHPSEITRLEVAQGMHKTYIEKEEIVYITSDDENDDVSLDSRSMITKKGQQPDTPEHLQVAKTAESHILKSKLLKKALYSRFKENLARTSLSSPEPRKTDPNSPDKQKPVASKTAVQMDQLARMGLDEQVNKQRNSDLKKKFTHIKKTNKGRTINLDD